MLATNAFPGEFKCSTTGAEITSPVLCTNGHKTDEIFLICRQIIGKHDCPRDGCTATMTGRVVDTNLQEKIEQWRTKNQHPETDAKLKFLEPIVDPRTRYVFAEVQRLDCGHLIERISATWTSAHSGVPCPTCGQHTLTSRLTKDRELQSEINKFIDGADWLPFSHNDNFLAATHLDLETHNPSPGTVHFPERSDSFPTGLSLVPTAVGLITIFMFFFGTNSDSVLPCLSCQFQGAPVWP